MKQRKTLFIIWSNRTWDCKWTVLILKFYTFFFVQESIKYSPYYTPADGDLYNYSEYFWWDCAEGNSAVQFTKERQNVCVCDVTWSDRHTPTQGDTDRQHSEEKHTRSTCCSKHSHESLHISFSCASLLKHSEIKRCSNT